MWYFLIIITYFLFLYMDKSKGGGGMGLDGDQDPLENHIALCFLDVLIRTSRKKQVDSSDPIASQGLSVKYVRTHDVL